jgi:flagellar biosynthesis component FlhA
VIEKLNALLPQKLIVRMGHQAHRRNAKTELEQLLKQHISRTKKNYSEETTSDLLTITSEIKALQNILTGLSALNQSIENTQNTIDSLRKQLTSEFFEQWNGTSLEMIEYWTLKHDIEIFFEHHNLLRKFEKTITPERYKKNQNHCFQIYYNNLPSSLKTYLLKTVTNESEMRSALQSILRCRQIELAHEELFSLKNKLLSFPSFTDLKHQLLTLHEKRIAHSRPLFEQYWLDKFERTTNEEKQNVITYLTVSK